MDEKKYEIMYDKYISIKFSNRVFYLPRIPANIYIENNTLTIDMADMDEYVLVDGLRCFYCVVYNADNGIIGTWIKDYTIDGLMAPQPHYYSFRLTDKEFPFSKRDSRVVVPKRDYSELTTVFLNEHKDLDARVVKFLKKHPELLEKALIREWLILSDTISKRFDPDVTPESISDFIVKELNMD